MSYLSGRVAYLSGPMEAAYDDEGINWRTEPKRILAERFGLILFDPHADIKQQWQKPLQEARACRDYETMATIARRFVQKDLTCVDTANLLIAHLPYKVPTTGTHHEIIRASDAKKPTLLVCPQGKELVPLWYYGFVPSSSMFSSWDELYAYLAEVEEGKHKDNRRWHFIYGLI